MTGSNPIPGPQGGGSLNVCGKSNPRAAADFCRPHVHDPASPPVCLPATPGSARRGAATILVVEDDANIRRLVAAMLRKFGYRTVAAESGSAALELAEQMGGIDLLLTDVMMPDMPGPELARRLGAAKSSLRVLFMSGCDGNAIARQDVLGVGIPLLSKPFGPEELLQAVRQALAGVAEE